MAEPDITGGGSLGSGPGTPKPKRSSSVARFGAKITTDGVDALERKFKSLLTTMRSVRQEMHAINNGGSTSGAGMDNNPSTSKLGNMIQGFNSFATAHPVAMQRASYGATFALGATATINGRTRRNMEESVAISAFDSWYVSRGYGANELDRFKFSGDFGGSRDQQQAAAGIGYRYGQMGGDQTNRFMQQMGNVVQASGGTLNIAQAAAATGDFMDPMVMRRAQSMGIPMGRIGGQVQNPNVTAMGYLRNFEQIQGKKFNAADFANLMAPGSGLRLSFKRRYGLDDSAIDQVVSAGQQTLANPGLNFNDAKSIEAAGLNNGNLALRSAELNTVVGKREASFFARQEGSMVNKLGQEILIQETLEKAEDAFGSLIGVLFQLENVIKGVTAALGVMGGLGMVGGMMGGGGGGGVGIPGVGGGGGAMGALGLGTVGVALGAGAFAVGKGGTGMSTAGAGLLGAGSGAALGGAIGMMGGPIGAAGGAAIGAAAGIGWGLYNQGQNSNKKDIRTGQDQAAGMTDEQLLKEIPDYIRAYRFAEGQGAGPKQRGRFDVWAARRGALVAGMMEEAKTELTKDNSLSTEQAGKYAQFINFFGSEETSNDGKLRSNKEDLEESGFIDLIRDKAPQIYSKYFGDVTGVFKYQPVTTPIASSLVMTAAQVLDSQITGDPVAGSRAPAQESNGGRGIGPGNPSWDNLDPRMKSRLSALVAASGGTTWVNQGWRSPAEQEREFRRRYYPSPDGDRTWQGQTWKKREGEAPLSAPGRSNHEIGMAADMGSSDNWEWLNQNASRFGLKTFLNVANNNEPWHVQLLELQNGFLGGEGTSGPDDPGMANTDSGRIGAPALAGGGGGGGGGGMGAMSGNGFNIVQALTGAGKLNRTGGGWAGTGASTTAGSVEGGGYSGGELTGVDVARLAYAAGFRGQDLINVVAIAKRESSYNPGTLNPNAGTGDYSFGLMQINMLGDMGPARREMFGISSNEELYDPLTNMRAAYTLYQNRGYQLTDWGAYKGRSNTYSTDIEAAAQAVAAAGLPTGDPVSTVTDRGPSASAGITINLGGVHIQSSGNVKYDADAFLRAIAPKLEEAAGMAMKRTTG